MKKISVFGATGFIGSRFCEMYPDDVIPIPRDANCAMSKDILYLISTTHNYNLLQKDVAVNLGKLSSVLSTLNFDVTFNFISSWFVYGDNGEMYNGENSGRRPKGNYSFTKKQAEDLVMFYCEREKIPYRIFRLANVFGKGDKFSRKKNALQYLINEMRHNRDIELYDGGEFYRDHIWVDDVCRILKAGMETFPVNDVYNVGSGKALVFKDLILMSHAVLGSKSKITSVEPSEFHKSVQVKSFMMGTEKIKKLGIELDSSPYEQLVRMILDE